MPGRIRGTSFTDRKNLRRRGKWPIDTSRRPSIHGRVTPHREGPARHLAWLHRKTQEAKQQKEIRTMKVMYPLTLAVAAAVVFATNSPLRASETDDRIESSFNKTYVYKTYLKDEKIKISSKDGAVTLSGSDRSYR